jgi:cytochrome c oxidase assembly protein subunit 15
MEAVDRRESQGPADILALGFGTSVAMWAVGYVCRMPPAVVPGWLLLSLMLACLVVGGLLAGRYASRGWRGGAYAGLLASALNLLILGSLLAGETPNRVVPSALWWVPGSFLVAVVLGGIGAWIGSRRPRCPPDPVNWTSCFAVVAVIATLLLLVAGGLVTSKEAGLAVVDWPNTFGSNMFLYPLSRMSGGIYYEHVHRLFGSLVGLTTLVLAALLQGTDERKWVPRFAWAALLGVITQGILGGLRVTGRLTFSTSPEEVAPNITLAIAHGVLGQIFFAMMVALVVFTSSGWRSDRQALPRRTAGTDRTLGAILVVMLILQLVFGAILRHVAGGVHIHIAMAVLVLLAALACGVRAWGLYHEEPILARWGRRLVYAVVLQVCLGAAALVAAGATEAVQPRPAADVIITTLHQAMGALLLACTVNLVLWTRRLLAPHYEE